MANTNKLKKVLILVSILAVPGFLYYLLTAHGKNRYKPLPFYGPKVLSGTSHKFHGKLIPDTTYHTVGDFKLTDQQGRQVTLKSIGPKILVVNFFYTNGPKTVNTVSASMDSLVYHFGQNKLITFASITVDPERDSAPILKKYAEQYKRSADKWLFLTGDTSVIYPLAHTGFMVDALQTGKNEFAVSNKIIMLDADHHIRGYYQGTSPDDITRMVDELKVQITEELRKGEKPLY